MVGLLPSEQSAGNTCISSCGRHGKAQPSRSFLRRVCVYLFLLAVAVGHTSAANCVPASGGSSGETFCTPERTELQLLKDVHVSADSTIKNGEQYCFVAGGKIDCDIANNDRFNVSNILQPAMRWQSAVLLSRMEEVSVTLRFATHLILYSIRLMFTNVPAVFAVQSSRNGGQDWKTLYTYVRDLAVCDTLPLVQTSSCGSFTPSAAVEVFSQQRLIDMLSKYCRSLRISIHSAKHACRESTSVCRESTSVCRESTSVCRESTSVCRESTSVGSVHDFPYNT